MQVRVARRELFFAPFLLCYNPCVNLSANQIAMMTVEIVRDFSIIFLALSTIVTQIILVLLLLEIRSLSKMLRENVFPILQSADETVRTVRGTSVFVSDNVVTPVVRVSSMAAGIQQALRVLARRGR
jgi:K+ transporter